MKEIPRMIMIDIIIIIIPLFGIITKLPKYHICCILRECLFL